VTETLEFPRGRDRSDPTAQVLRLEIESYEGHEYVSVRIWFRGSDGELRPTKQGVTIRSRELERAAEWLSRASREIGTDGPERSAHRARRSPAGQSVPDVRLPPEQEDGLF
jgi:hypothetical protein